MTPSLALPDDGRRPFSHGFYLPLVRGRVHGSLHSSLHKVQ